MAFKPFLFQQFPIKQAPDVFSVGTDAVLLGALANLEKAAHILEVGTGTGIVSLMLAQRYPEASFLGIEVHPKAAVLAAENFRNSPFSGRLQAILANFQDWTSLEKYEAIVCNPPYFAPNSSGKLVLARQQRALTLESLIKKSAECLTAEGNLQFIYPAGELDLIEKWAAENGLYLNQVIHIYGRAGQKIKRQLVMLYKKEDVFQEKNFIIEETPRQYSAQYLEATRDFHLFSKNE